MISLFAQLRMPRPFLVREFLRLCERRKVHPSIRTHSTPLVAHQAGKSGSCSSCSSVSLARMRAARGEGLRNVLWTLEVHSRAIELADHRPELSRLI